jgi:hypothetical protein
MFWGRDVLGLGTFCSWDVLRLGTFWGWDILGLGTFWSWDVLELGCSVLGHFVLGRFLGALWKTVLK